MCRPESAGARPSSLGEPGRRVFSGARNVARAELSHGDEAGACGGPVSERSDPKTRGSKGPASQVSRSVSKAQNSRYTTPPSFGSRCRFPLARVARPPVPEPGQEHPQRAYTFVRIHRLVTPVPGEKRGCQWVVLTLHRSQRSFLMDGCSAAAASTPRPFNQWSGIPLVLWFTPDAASITGKPHPGCCGRAPP